MSAEPAPHNAPNSARPPPALERGAAQASEWAAIGTHRFALGEGGRWDGSRFWQVDLVAGTLWRAGSALTELDLVLAAGRPVGCLLPTEAGWVLLAGRGVAAVDLDDLASTAARASLRMLCEPAPPGHRINDGAVLGGCVYFGTMDEAGTPGQGAVWRMDPDGVVTQIIGDLGCPNGPAFDTGGNVMYLADSTRAVIRRYELRADASLGTAETFATFPDSVGTPDGMTVDQEGGLWVAMWDGAAIRRYGPDGTLQAEIAVPVRRPTSVTIAPGAVVVTSARGGLSRPGPLDGATIVLRHRGVPHPV